MKEIAMRGIEEKANGCAGEQKMCDCSGKTSDEVQRWVDSLSFDERGLMPAIVQDWRSGTVLMLAWTNKEAILETLSSGRTVFWSRSRSQLWRKGDTSGNYQVVKEVLYDCDADSLLIKVEPAGAACHTGHTSCFYRNIVFGPTGAAARKEGGEEIETADDVLTEVYSTILERKRILPSGSYVASLMAGGLDRILKKIPEEAGEVVLAAKNANRGEIVYEIADLWFHSLVALAYYDIEPDEVFAELRRRRKPR